MSTKHFFLSASLLFGFAACAHNEHGHNEGHREQGEKAHHGKDHKEHHKPASRPSSRPSEAASAVPAGKRISPASYDHFGDGVAAGPQALSVADLFAKSDALAGKKVRLTGKVQSVCKKKGCWMILEDGGKQVRVKFRGYGFFMPLDCEEREVVLTGSFTVKTIPVAEARHYLEDAGKPEEAAKITEPQKEFTVMADGVAMKRRAE